MEKILKELTQKENIRTNLSNLRQLIKADEAKISVQAFIVENEVLVLGFLKHEDAKTRKNAALLLGDMQYQNALEGLMDAYQNEQTLFVKASYLQALMELEIKDELSKLKAWLDELSALEVTLENKKHIDEQIRALRKIIIAHEGISRHEIDIEKKDVDVLLMTNRSQRETIRRTITYGTAKIHPLGIEVHTDELSKLIELRTYREIAFLLDTKDFLPAEPVEAAKILAGSNMLSILRLLHTGEGSFYFRIECKSSMDLEARSAFTKKLGAELERQTKGQMINSTSDYEVEIRLIMNKEGNFFPCMLLNTLKSNRFSYRKNAIATSIHPSTAALIMELAKPYLKENAQIMDPFCGVGTMLIERDNAVGTKQMYGTDIFGDAIIYARENSILAGKQINYIHRDFMDFKHEYLFDEIITNMPLRGKKTKQEMDAFYQKFFDKMPEILNRDAVVILYTNEIGFVKKQLRLHKEFALQQETCLQPKNDFYLLILSYKRGLQ